MTTSPPKLYGLGLALFVLPALAFIGRNLRVYTLDVLWPPLGIACAVALAVYLVCLIASRLIGSGMGATLYVAGACFWFFQFWYGELAAQMPLLANERLAALLIACCALLISLVTRWPGVHRTILVFLGLNLALVAAGHLTADRPPQKTERPTLFKLPAPAEFHAPAPRELNIYYVILDGLSSERVLEQRFGIDVTESVQRLVKEHSYFVAPAARSSYNATYLTLSSIFYQTYPVTEASGPYPNRTPFFPRLLSNAGQVSLFNSLQKLGYRFTHIGNSWGPCNASEQVLCLTDHAAKTSVLVELMNNYAARSFFVGSLVEPHMNRIHVRQARDAASINDNDAIRTFMRVAREHPAMTQRKRNFFFIHHMNPHPPARDDQCNLLDGGYYTVEDARGYGSSVLCAFRRIQELTDFIAREDPGAMVVLQADHGAGVSFDFSRRFEENTPAHLDERFSIFNALKVPTECASGLREDLGNVETINLVLGCAGGSLPVTHRPRSYVGFYEGHPDFGMVFRAFGAEDSQSDGK